MKSGFPKELKKYQREIRSFLIVRTKESNRFMSELKESMNGYIEANKICDINAVREHFGTPKQIAKAFLDTAELSYIRKRVRIKNAVLAVLLAALIIWLGYASVLFIDGLISNHTDSYAVEGPYSSADDPYIQGER